MSRFQFAVQLYTLRKEQNENFAATLKEVARIGYDGIELAGFGNLKTAREVKTALDDAGLKVCAGHWIIEQLETELSKILDDNELLENKTIVCPWMPEDRRKDAAGWKSAAEGLTKIGAACQKRGFTFCYHHHSFEFARFDGKSGMDILLASADANLVRIEIDTYWAAHGGEDPVAFINRLGNRVALLHAKDMADGPEQRFAPVGEGKLKFGEILRATAKLGVRWIIVEQDNCYDTPPIQAVRTSFKNLQKLDTL